MGRFVSEIGFLGRRKKKPLKFLAIPRISVLRVLVGVIGAVALGLGMVIVAV